MAPIGSRVELDTSAYNAFPTMILDGAGLRLMYRYGTAHNSPEGEIDERISTDGGATWPSSGTVIATITDPNDLRDPALVKTSTGRYVVIYDRREPYNSTNIDTTRLYSDDGTTWSSNYTLPSSYAGPLASVASGCAIMDGSDIIVPGFAEDGGPEFAFFWRSADDGATFAIDTVIAEDATTDFQEPVLQILASGRWLCLLRSESNHHTWRTYSDDGGATWSEPEDVNEMTGRPDFIEYRAGRLLQFGRYDTTGDSPPYYAVSLDDGATWSTPAEVDPGETDLHMYAALVKAADGEVTAAYALESDSSTSGLYFRVFSDH